MQQEWQALHRITNIVSRLVVAAHSPQTPEYLVTSVGAGHTPAPPIRDYWFVENLDRVQHLLNENWKTFATPGSVQDPDDENIQYPINRFVYHHKKALSQASTPRSGQIPENQTDLAIGVVVLYGRFRDINIDICCMDDHTQYGLGRNIVFCNTDVLRNTYVDLTTLDNFDQRCLLAFNDCLELRQ